MKLADLTGTTDLVKGVLLGLGVSDADDSPVFTRQIDVHGREHLYVASALGLAVCRQEPIRGTDGAKFKVVGRVVYWDEVDYDLTAEAFAGPITEVQLSLTIPNEEPLKLSTTTDPDGENRHGVAEFVTACVSHLHTQRREKPRVSSGTDPTV